jgi:arsenate reductase-like glutaredoxin family protein
VRLLQERGYEVVKRNVQRMQPAELQAVASLLATDQELRDVLVHEKKREQVAGRSREEILACMAADYTFINRPVAVRGRSVAAGPLRHNQDRYDRVFPG